MFHAQTEVHIKEHIISSMAQQAGTVRVVFATVALGMGVHFSDLNLIIHYGAPSSIDDYFRECGRSGRGGDGLDETPLSPVSLIKLVYLHVYVFHTS